MTKEIDLCWKRTSFEVQSLKELTEVSSGTHRTTNSVLKTSVYVQTLDHVGVFSPYWNLLQ